MKLSPLLFAAIAAGGLSLTTHVQAQTTSPDVMSPNAVDNTLTYDDYMRLGYDAQQAGQYYEAAQYFRNALYLNPRDRAATVAYWNVRGALRNPTDQTIAFDDYMNRGYDATEAGNYSVALENFQQALALRPGNYYATQAIRNVQTYIAGGPIGLVNPAPTDPQGGVGGSSTTPEAFVGEQPYDRYMRLGYADLQSEDYGTAANYFRSALFERPNDRWATIAYWNAIDGVLSNTDGTETEPRYDRLMRLGYDATQRANYEAALAFFEAALAERPSDYYATEAIENVSTYLEE